MTFNRDCVGIALFLAIAFCPAAVRAQSSPSSTSPTTYETVGEVGKVGIMSILVVSITSQIVRKSKE